MSLKQNVIANYFGQGWRVLMNLAFIPLYIKYLGIEAYGLIGIFALLQAWLGLLDIGMKPALGREMARFTAGAHDNQSIRDLLRSIEIIALVIAGFIALGIWLASDWLATDWVKAENISTHVVSQAFSILGFVVALSFVQNIYVSGLVGLQRQVLQNTILSIVATLQGFGAVGVMIWISPTIQAFFIWQGIISLASLLVLAGSVYSILPVSSRHARFSGSALITVWRFAAGMMTITLLSLLLTQVDKVILSRLLSLELFGYYTLAAMVAGGLYMLVGPITAAFYPRFVELTTNENQPSLKQMYHQAAQLVSVVMGSAAIVLMTFGNRVLALWTSDPMLTTRVAPLMTVLVLGTLLNGLMWVPYQLQLAHGWTSLAIKVNCLAVAILVPAVLWVVPNYGAIGAAWVWVSLNTGYILFSIYFMHRRLLPTEKWRWYRQDVVFPMAGATAAAAFCRFFYPQHLGRIGELGVLLVCAGFIILASGMSASLVRAQIRQHLAGGIKAIRERAPASNKG